MNIYIYMNIYRGSERKRWCQIEEAMYGLHEGVRKPESICNQQTLARWVHTCLCHTTRVTPLALHPLDARSRMQVASEGAADRSNTESCYKINAYTQVVSMHT